MAGGEREILPARTCLPAAKLVCTRKLRHCGLSSRNPDPYSVQKHGNRRGVESIIRHNGRARSPCFLADDIVITRKIDPVSSVRAIYVQHSPVTISLSATRHDIETCVCVRVCVFFMMSVTDYSVEKWKRSCPNGTFAARSLSERASFHERDRRD